MIVFGGAKNFMCGGFKADLKSIDFFINSFICYPGAGIIKTSLRAMR
jgi:hypothetical protein